MAHIILAAEGYVDGLRKFEEAFNGREYANGTSKVRVREIKLYHLGFNDRGSAYKEILADLKSLFRYKDADRPKDQIQEDTTTELHHKFQKYIRFFRKFFKSIKSIDTDIDSVKESGFRDEMGSKGIWFNTVLIPIGRVDDYKNSEGEEMV